MKGEGWGREKGETGMKNGNAYDITSEHKSLVHERYTISRASRVIFLLRATSDFLSRPHVMATFINS